MRTEKSNVLDSITVILNFICKYPKIENYLHNKTVTPTKSGNKKTGNNK